MVSDDTVYIAFA